MKAKLDTIDVIVVGGGLAGLSSAIHLSKANHKVVLIEKSSYPRHKVCGEYVSNEVLPYLKFLGFDPFHFGAKKINQFELTTHSNKKITAQLPLGGFGMSRYQMDYQLYLLAQNNGVQVCQDSVTQIDFDEGVFSVKTKSEATYRAKLVIGAYGKRSNLDVTLNRSFMARKSPYLGVKSHISGDFPDNKVALHNFKGGYCGLSKVENNHINLCYITNFKSFKAYKDIDSFQKEVLFKNEALKQMFQNSVPEFESPLT